MPVRRTEGPTPDLFPAVASKAAPAEEQENVPKVQIGPTNQSSLPRYLLPKDLAGALTRLDDGEIDALLATVTHEAGPRHGAAFCSGELSSVPRPRATVLILLF